MKKYIDNFRSFVASFLNRDGKLKETIIGELEKDIIAFLKNENIEPFSNEIYISIKGYSHLDRDTKKQVNKALDENDIEKLPILIEEAELVLFDTDSRKLNLIYATTHIDNTYYNKIVIDPQSYDKKLGAKTLVKTAGKVEKHNLNDKRYKVIKKGNH